MRVSQLADLAGTTVRTIRHYHAIGLLPVPPEDGGYRDYNLSHVARLGRIRWLVEAGLTLPTIAVVMTEDSSTRADLEASLAAVDERLAELGQQRDRLVGLLDAVASGEELSPLPPVISRFYATLLAHATDESVRRRIRVDRVFAELGFYRGAIPPEAVALFDVLDGQRITASLTAFGELDRDLSDAEVETMSDDVLARIESRLGDADLARRVDTQFLATLYEGFIGGTDGAQRRIARATLPKLLAAIEDWRQR